MNDHTNHMNGQAGMNNQMGGSMNNMNNMAGQNAAVNQGHGVGNGHGASNPHGPMNHHAAAAGHGTVFRFANTQSKILFDTWHPKTDGELIGACFAVFFMTFFWFVLQAVTYHLRKKWGLCSGSDRSKTESEESLVSKSSIKYKILNRLTKIEQWTVALLCTLNMGWGYFLMLIAMTFNGWLFLSILLGAFVGNLVVGSESSSLC